MNWILFSFSVISLEVCICDISGLPLLDYLFGSYSQNLKKTLGRIFPLVSWGSDKIDILQGFG